MKIAFDKTIKFSPSSIEKLETINLIVEDYMDQGFRLTLRQLYYQLVSRDIIPNADNEYKKIGTLLKKGRMGGYVDWDAIEDRGRVPKLPYIVDGVQDAMYDAKRTYRLDRQQDQDKSIEVWVEKDALSAILERVTRKYHVRLMVNKGYSSITAMYKASERLESGDTILYFGDHDPSGLDMIRDVKDRLMLFGKDIDVVPVALTMEQIKQFNPPPNPTKITDTRAAWYIEQHGHVSWELDALPPPELIKLAEEGIKSRINLGLYQEMLDTEEEDKATIQRFIDEKYGDNEE